MVKRKIVLICIALIAGVGGLYFLVQKVIDNKTTPYNFNISKDLTSSDLYPPTNLKISKITDSKMTLSWKFKEKKFIPNGLTWEYGVHSGYRIYRDGFWLVDIPSSSVSYTDTGLYPGETYKYKMSALTFDNKIEGVIGSEIKGKTSDGKAKEIKNFNYKNISRYLAEGDSITFGSMANKNDGWVDQVGQFLHKQNPDSTMFNKGVMGYYSSDVAKSLSSDISDTKPDFITVAVGINDMVNGVGLGVSSLGTYRDNLRKIVGEIKSDNINMLLLSVYYVDCCYEKNVIWNKAVRDVANEYAIPYVDVYTPMKNGGGNSLILGGGHPNQLGHDIIAETVINKLKELNSE